MSNRRERAARRIGAMLASRHGLCSKTSRVLRLGNLPSPAFSRNSALLPSQTTTHSPWSILTCLVELIETPPCERSRQQYRLCSRCGRSTLHRGFGCPRGKASAGGGVGENAEVKSDLSDRPHAASSSIIADRNTGIVHPVTAHQSEQRPRVLRTEPDATVRRGPAEIANLRRPMNCDTVIKENRMSHRRPIVSARPMKWTQRLRSVGPGRCAVSFLSR